MDAAGLDGLAAAFLAVDEDEREGDFSSLALDGVDGLEGRAAGGDDVVHDDDIVPGLEVAFDLLASPVTLGFLADGEDLEGFGRVLGSGGHPDGEGDRVGAEGHAADGVDFQMLGVDFGTDGVPAEVADEVGSERIERGHAAVDVEIALLAGGQGERAGADGFLQKEFLEGGGGVEHGEEVEHGSWKVQPRTSEFSRGRPGRSELLLASGAREGLRSCQMIAAGLMEPSGLIEQGGPLVWVLLGLAFVGAVCVVERLFFFHRARINVGDLLTGLAHHIRRRAFAEALHEAARAPGPVARVAHAALLRYYLPRADLRDVVQEAGQMEVPRIEKNIRAILGAALLAPLVGMLGTLVGMLETFQKVSELGGFTGPAELSAGVFMALITSVIGLTVAVPLYLFYLYFLGRAKRLVHRLERAGIEMVHLIADAREEEEFAPFRGETTGHKKPVKPKKDTVK